MKIKQFASINYNINNLTECSFILLPCVKQVALFTYFFFHYKYILFSHYTIQSFVSPLYPLGVYICAFITEFNIFQYII